MDVDCFEKGAEVVTVHRKMEAKGRSFFMEYEFFPDRKDTNFKEREVENLGLGLGFQDPKSTSCLKISEYNSAATTTTPNSVDLSLKLSF